MTSPQWSGSSTYTGPRPSYQLTPPATAFGTTPVPPPTQAPVVRRASPWPWVMLGTGLALALAGGVLDVVALVEWKGADQFTEVDQIEPWANRVEAEALAADVLLFVGAAIAIGGLIWVILDRRRRSAHGASSQRWTGSILEGRLALL